MYHSGEELIEHDDAPWLEKNAIKGFRYYKNLLKSYIY